MGGLKYGPWRHFRAMGNIYEDPRRYDLVLEAMDDLPLWAALAQEYGNDGVIDWFCGSGRVALSLAQQGHRVIGVDAHQKMLKRAQCLDTKQQVSWVQGDVRAVDSAMVGSLGIVAANSLGHLSSHQDLVRALKAMAGHLSPGGMLAVSHFRPDVVDLADADGTFQPLCAYEDGGERIEVLHASSYDSRRQIQHNTWQHVNAQTTAVVSTGSFALRVIFPQEFQMMVAAAGLTCVQEWGDHHRGPVTDESPLSVYLLRPT